jgi:NAD(P)-dependent dehydrogenase (short-subunit alcohol dehydrogenase family)
MDLGSRLAGRHVLVTGASSGLGEHFARLAASCGATVTVAARRRERLDALVREIGADTRAIDLDVTDEASVLRAFDGFGADLPHVVVNNAGIAGAGAALDTSADEFDRVMDTNLRGVWLVATEAARRWRAAKTGGTIVNIASIAGQRVAGGMAPYAASKAAVIQLTKALALEWARYGVRVNALAPGYIGTEINADFFASEAGAAMIKRIPMRRLGRPEDLDGAFLLLATDASSWMTGSVVNIDGGHLLASL